MISRHSRAAINLAILLAGCLCILPACSKKKKSDDNTDGGPLAGYSGSKSGPPGNSRQTFENLKQIGRACHNYHDAMNGLPHAIADANGKPGLSWRVALLPYIGQNALYGQFKLSEPWNSEHNKKLIGQMPTVYASNRGSADGKTDYRSFTGQGAIMPPPTQPAEPGKPFRGLSLASISDGAANTFMIVESGEAVIWTKPEELAFSPGKPPKLGSGAGDRFYAVMVDGSVRQIRGNLDARTLSNAIQTNDGQIVDLD
jgi:uncharacterized protein DUF1559